jgi:hypothetical protein
MLGNDDFMIDLDRAREAAERGDLREAERWTALAERKLAMIRHTYQIVLKAGWKPEMLKDVIDASK